jgi:Nucleotidyltransferase domain
MNSVLHEGLRTLIPEVLARYAIGPEDLLQVKNFEPTDTVLLTGSHARGEATATSDLDITVICDIPPDRGYGARGYPSTFGDSVVAAKINTLVLNVDYLRRDMLRTVCSLLASSAASPASNIANLSPLELRSLERAGSGLVLQLGSDDGELLDNIDLPTVCANTAAIAFLEGCSHLRAVDSGELDPSSRALRLHYVGECLLLAEVNAVGLLTYDIKHLAGRVRKLASAPYLTLLDALALNGAAKSPQADVLAAARVVTEAFLASLSADAGRDLVRRMLRPVLDLPEAPDSR